MRDIATKFQLLYLCLNRATWLHLCDHCLRSGWLVYQRWRSVTGSGYIPQTLTWKSIRNSPVMMLDANNIGMLRARFRNTYYPLEFRCYLVYKLGCSFTSISGFRVHLIHPDKRQCLDQSRRVAWHWKLRYNRRNFVAFMYTSWYARYSLSISNNRPPSLIYYSPWRGRVFALALSFSLDHKNCASLEVCW